MKTWTRLLPSAGRVFAEGAAYDFYGLVIMFAVLLDLIIERQR